MWGLPGKDCGEAVKHFIKAYDRPYYPCLKREIILRRFKLAEQLKHDVFDCVYLAFAEQEKAAEINLKLKINRKLGNRIIP